MEEHQSQAPTMWTISLKEKFCKSLSWTSPLHARNSYLPIQLSRNYANTISSALRIFGLPRNQSLFVTLFLWIILNNAHLT